MFNLKKIEKPVEIEDGDSFKVILSKYGALALDKQENLAELIGETIGDLDIENEVISFDDIKMQVHILGFYSQDLNQWSWAWDCEEIFGNNLIASAVEIKKLGDKFGVSEFNSPLNKTDFNFCHTIAMTATTILGFDGYYAVSEDGLDIFVAIESDLVKENNDVKKYRDTFYTFQKKYNIFPKIAYESYTKLKGYGFKPQDGFYLAKIGESRVMAGFTERGNVTRILMFGEDEQ
ncbi:MAG: hypothetical protein Q4E99_05845 [Bacillota bacterium]|nr:hypothetical protein [Bacillota bacterium]